jgi:UDP-glucose-4-epimerase GalE
LNILVIGGAGYIGSHQVKQLLAAGHSVTVFDNFSRGHRSAVLTDAVVEGDLLSSQDIAKPFVTQRFDAVMHFAALCYVGESMNRPAEYYRNNVTGTLNLLDAMRAAGVKNLVFSSTCATFGSPQAVPMDEDHPQRPINPYGASKLMVERILKDYAAAYGLNSVALRYFNAAGCDPRARIGECHEPETHLIPLALKEAQRVQSGGDPALTSLEVFGDDYDTPDGTCIRDYVHVEDLAAAHTSAAEKMIRGSMQGARAYNLGSGSGFSVLEVIGSCIKASGTEITYRIGVRRPGDPSRLVATSEAARRDLNWNPRFKSLDEIVATAWNWMRKR